MAKALKSEVTAGTAFFAYMAAYALVLAPPPIWWISASSQTVIALAGLYALLGCVVERACGVERTTWRYVSINDTFDLVRSTLLTATAFLVIAFVTNHADDVPWSVLPLTWGMHLVGLCALRGLRRMAHEGSLVRAIAPLPRRAPAAGRAILLVGPVTLAESFLRELAREARPQYRPLGILTVDPADVGQVVRGISVIGVVGDLEQAIEMRRAAPDEAEAILFLSRPGIVQDIASDILVRLKTSGLSLLRLPAMHEISATHASLPAAIRELSVEELLARPPVRLDLSRIHELVNGKRVLVTGAGGSIGSELCRQVAAYGCAHLALLDHSEFALFKIDQEIGVAHPGLQRSELICDVRDRARVLACVRAETPDIIFHAAALKHVPMVENHPAEALLTNVVGTWNVAEAARAHANWVAPYWAPRLSKVAAIGTHIFYRWKGAWGLPSAFTGVYRGVEPVVSGMHGLRTLEPERLADITPAPVLTPPAGPEFADVAPRPPSSFAAVEGVLATISDAPELLIPPVPADLAPQQQASIMADPLVSPAQRPTTRRPRIATPSGW